MEPHSPGTDLNIMNSLRMWLQFVSANTSRKPHEPPWCKFPSFYFFFSVSLMDICVVRLALQGSYKYRNEILITCLNSSTTGARSHTTEQQALRGWGMWALSGTKLSWRALWLNFIFKECFLTRLFQEPEVRFRIDFFPWQRGPCCPAPTKLPSLHSLGHHRHAE